MKTFGKGGPMMNLMKYNRPGNSFDLLGSFFNDFPSYNYNPERRLVPLVDIYENDNKFFLEAQLPGIKKEDIKIEVENGKLFLSAESCKEKEINEDKYYRKEISKGKFVRSFYLPESVDKDSLKANFKDGVLKIEIPKSEKEKPKQIFIN